MFTGKSSYSIRAPECVETTYNAYPVKVPKDFLSPLYDPGSVKIEWIDFEKCIPEYTGCVAAIIDNIVSERECRELIYLAETAAGLHQEVSSKDEDGSKAQETESSDPTLAGQGRPGRRGWQPALVAAGPGAEFNMKDYRNSDRIIWDKKEVTRRIWARMMQIPELRDRLSELKGEDYRSLGGDPEKFIARAKGYGINERMRFLRYGPAQFFKPHADSMFSMPDGSEKSYFTVHLYLNDSEEVLDEKNRQHATLSGGSTPFLSGNRKSRIDVWPKAGRILLFQQRRLVHSGEKVKRGIKYTVRSDIMYDVIPVTQIQQTDGRGEQSGDGNQNNNNSSKN